MLQSSQEDSRYNRGNLVTEFPRGLMLNGIQVLFAIGALEGKNSRYFEAKESSTHAYQIPTFLLAELVVSRVDYNFYRLLVGV